MMKILGLSNESSEPPKIIESPVTDYYFETSPLGTKYKVYKKPLGKGGFGTVFKCEDKDGNVYAMKMISASTLNKDGETRVKNEVESMQKLSHPNILRIVDNFPKEQGIRMHIIVMEYAMDGDLSGFISHHRNQGKAISEEKIVNILLQIAHGLNYMHSLNIVHKDIKPLNILRFGDTYKISDFGLSKELTGDYTKSITSTIVYMPPESLDKNKVGLKGDIWALGCVAYELCNLKKPFSSSSPHQELIKSIVKGNIPSFTIDRSNKLKKLVMKMLTVNEGKRISAKELVRKLEKF